MSFLVLHTFSKSCMPNSFKSSHNSMICLIAIYVGFYFLILYWQNLLPGHWQFLSWCSGWRVNICTDVTRTLSGHRWASWLLTVDPDADCFLSSLFPWSPCCHPLKFLQLLPSSPPPICSRVLICSPSSGPQHSWPPSGMWVYTVPPACLVHGPEPVCAQAAAAEP